MAERDRPRFTSVLAADPEVDVRPGLASELARHLDELAHSVLVEDLERIVLVDPLGDVLLQELAGVVAGESTPHLGEVVRPEAEELRLAGDLVGGDRGTRDLDHRPHLVRDVIGGEALFLEDLLCSLVDHRPLQLELLDVSHERDHDLGMDLDPLLVHGARRLDDRTGLHLGDLRIGDPEPAAAMPEHRVELVQRLYLLLDFFHRDSHRLRDFALSFSIVREELVQRRVQKPDRHRAGPHGAEDPLEIAALHREELGERLAPTSLVVGEDHLAHGDDPISLEEHVFGAAEPDPLCAELHRLGGVVRGVGVGAHPEAPDLVGPGEDGAEVPRQLRLNCRDLSQVDGAGGAVQADRVPFLHCVPVDGELALRVVDHQISCPSDAALPHPAGDDGGVARHPAAGGEDPLRGVHPTDVLR